MSKIPFNPTAPKKSIDLSINAKIVRQKKYHQWLAENQVALEEYNCRIEKHGTFSDGLKRF